METIAYSQIQELVMRLPARRLPCAYSFLVDLANTESEESSPQPELVSLPLTERRRILAQQAEQMAAHYEQTAVERQTWQGGDFIDEY